MTKPHVFIGFEPSNISTTKPSGLVVSSALKWLESYRILSTNYITGWSVDLNDTIQPNNKIYFYTELVAVSILLSLRSLTKPSLRDSVGGGD